jgi:capsular exopolysaccharide synthesis family protein
VTSANMMEGKTTVIANLGIASAERKRRVLLVDADLRRPQLHAVFKLGNERGLTTALEKYSGHGDTDISANISLESCIQQGSVPGLSVMTSGPAGSANLLYSCDLGALIERLRKEYDLVFIDTPPMGLYSESRVLGRMSDGVVMVVRADSTRSEQLRQTYVRLMQDQIPVIGTILNQWKMDPSHHKAYGRYYANYRGA